jgi:hypothetical protein
MSSFYQNHRSRVIDGDISPNSGYKVKLIENPAVIIDLFQREEITSIIIFENMNQPSMSTRQLTLFISKDEKQWDTIASVTTQIDNHRPIRIEFDSPKTTRYVKIETSGSGSLSLDEVEVYGN